MYNNVASGFGLSEMAVRMMKSSAVKSNHPKSNLFNKSTEQGLDIKLLKPTEGSQ